MAREGGGVDGGGVDAVWSGRVGPDRPDHFTDLGLGLARG